MTAQHLANRLAEVLLNGKWIANTNIKEQIENTSWQQATQQFGTLNTIAALTYHVNYYIGGVLQALNGGTLDIRDQYSFDMPPIHSESDWKKLIDAFTSNAEQFVKKVEQLDETIFDTDFVDPKYGSYRRNIEGLIEHSYYHLGQISLLKKMKQLNNVTKNNES